MGGHYYFLVVSIRSSGNKSTLHRKNVNNTTLQGAWWVTKFDITGNFFPGLKITHTHIHLLPTIIFQDKSWKKEEKAIAS